MTVKSLRCFCLHHRDTETRSFFLCLLSASGVTLSEAHQVALLSQDKPQVCGPQPTAFSFCGSSTAKHNTRMCKYTRLIKNSFCFDPGSIEIIIMIIPESWCR